MFMSGSTICQSEFDIDLGEDLDIWITGRIQIENFDPGYPSQNNSKYFEDPGDCGEPATFDPGKIIITVGEADIEIEGESAAKIYAVIKSSLESKIEKIGEMHNEAMMQKIAEDRADDIADYKRWRKGA
jgi:hypothetical protein